MAVGELKTHFSEVLQEVRQGKKVGILYGRVKKPVAMIVPYQKENKGERKIGILDGKATVKFMDDFEMTAEELCNLWYYCWTLWGFELMPLIPLDALMSLQLPQKTNHKDPFDRMLVYQCITGGYTLASNDKKVEQYETDGLKLIW